MVEPGGRTKLVPSRARLQKETFQEVARILVATKLSLGIEGNVPIMFVKDENNKDQRKDSGNCATLVIVETLCLWCACLL